MDARILWSGQGLQATRYALQYALRRQTVLDNVAVVGLAFQKRVTREMELQTTEYAKAIGRLLSLAYSSSGVMEIGAPLATVIIHVGEAVTLGCIFERLVLTEGLNLLDRVVVDRVVEAAVSTRNREMFAETSIARYINRPRCLEGFCWYDFCSWIHHSAGASSHGTRQCVASCTNVNQLREHVRVHHYHYLEYTSVPEIIGPRLPDETRLGDEDYEEQSELYYRMVALLYRPFRDVHVFLGDSGSARGHFERWRPSSDANVARALERHQQHYICLKHAQDYRAEDRHEPGDESDDCEVYVDDDILPNFAARQSEDARQAVNYEPVPAEFYSDDGDVDVEPDLGSRSFTQDASPIADLLTTAIASSPLPPDKSFGLTVSSHVITRSHIRRFQTKDCTFGVPSVSDGIASPTTTPPATTTITLEAYHEAVRDLTYTRASCPPPRLHPFASIRDVSAVYNLNYLQHVAFSLIAVPLLRKIVGNVGSHTDSSPFDGKPIIITGAGGTGKSQIIAAVRGLVTTWCQPQAVAVVASTGIAAARLQGTTIHSSVGLGINTTELPKHITSPSDTLLRQWAPVHCVIADELSMIDLGLFGLWEESLHYAKDNRGCDYGGVLVVLMFDHCQLRTVKDMPMFQTKNGDTPLSPAQDRGLLLYRSITKAVYLTENMRFLQDPEWGPWLASARLGIWTDDCRAFITSLANRHPKHSSGSRGVLHTISTDNQSRSATNETATRLAARHFGAERKVYVIPAQLSRRPTPSEIAVLKQFPDNKTGHIPLFSHVYVGMPVRVKANQCVPNGVANGAIATVHHIDWSPTTTIALQPDGTWLASAHPRNLYVNISKCNPGTPYPGLPTDWPASVMPIHQATASITVSGSSLSIKGYPIVPAFGTTVHGVQGETLDAVALTNLRPPHVRRVDKHAMYVALSRVRTREGLRWIGAPPGERDFDFFRPEPAVLLEDTRLKRLAESTLSHFVSASECVVPPPL